MKEIIKLIQFDAMLETGTFRGVTTEWLSTEFEGPIVSVEIDKRYFLYAQKRLRSRRNVVVHLCDSRDLLRELLGGELKGKQVLIYLDAHWRLDLPLWEEIAIVAESCADATVVVDDFRVEGDMGYGYDVYEGSALAIDRMPESALQGWSAYWPALPSTRETGSKRGCVVLCRGERMNVRLRKCALLRPASLREGRQE